MREESGLLLSYVSLEKSDNISLSGDSSQKNMPKSIVREKLNHNLSVVNITDLNGLNGI